MKNKLFFNILIVTVIVLSMLPSRLLAKESAVNPLTEQKSSLARTCESHVQLIPMLIGHTNLAQFALLGLQFPGEALDPVKQERVIHIRGIQQPLKLNIPYLLDHSAVTCGGMCRMTSCRPAGQGFMSI